MVVYSVQSTRDIFNVILPHLDRYPLITQKKADYLLFKQAVSLLNLKAHLDIEGFRKIISIKASMNSGLPCGPEDSSPRAHRADQLKQIKFPTVVPALRPIVSVKEIPNLN